VQLRRKIQGLRFRRQHPVGPFVLDFYCDSSKFAVEVDGHSHSLGRAPLGDIERDDWLALRGIRVVRLPASLVMDDMDAAIQTILAAADGARRSPPHP
jgi:very-short-patch-repair endonuclease